MTKLLAWRRMVIGESHYFLGQRYRLRVIEEGGAPRLKLRGMASMLLSVRPDTTARHVFDRAELKACPKAIGQMAANPGRYG